MEARHVTSWSGKVLNKAAADRIDNDDKHNWDGVSFLQQSGHDRSRTCDNGVAPESDQFFRRRLDEIGCRTQPAKL